MSGQRMKLRLKIHPAGAALAALGLLLLPSAGMLAAAAAMALHEGGHVLAMALCGVRECRIELTPFGGVADVPGFERLPARRQCLIALAGVPFSAVCAGLCLRFAPPAEFFRLFYRFSLGMALVNVLPVWPLDGARLLLCAARRLGWEEAARQGMLWLAYLLAAAMLALGVAGVFQDSVNLSLFLLPPYLAYAAWQSSVGESLRSAASALEKKPWPEGKLLRAIPLVCRGNPEKVELLRSLRALPAERAAILYRFDAEGGKLAQVLSGPEMAGLLTEEHPSKKRRFSTETSNFHADGMDKAGASVVQSK